MVTFSVRIVSNPRQDATGKEEEVEEEEEEEEEDTTTTTTTTKTMKEQRPTNRYMFVQLSSNRIFNSDRFSLSHRSRYVGS